MERGRKHARLIYLSFPPFSPFLSGKNKKKTMKQKKKQEEMEAKDMASMIASALKLADEGPKAPEKVEEKEAYFMEQVSKGESLLPLGM